LAELSKNDTAATWEIVMFWTAFIWGLGASSGASFGILLCVMLFDLWSKIARSERIKRVNELADLANAALMRRNELTEQQIAKLGEIVTIMDDALSLRGK
jgi:hypothetical protein